VASVLIEVVGNLTFIFWLKKLGVRLIFGFSGIPGYPERAYVKWCRTQGCSPKFILVLRCLSFLNMILAAVVTIFLII
jgi:hypothetical protein